METSPTQQPALQISADQLLAFVSAATGGRVGRPDDGDPLPPGPWDPVVRVALEQIEVFNALPTGPIAGAPPSSIDPRADPPGLDSLFRRHPEIFGAVGGAFGDEVSLNPQPLPPRAAFLVAAAQAVIRRAELLQEIAGALYRDDPRQGGAVAGGYARRFSDDWCGTGFKFRWPLPGPRPRWFPRGLDGVDLLVVAAQFRQAADAAFDEDLRQHLTDASASLADAGMRRLQGLLDAAPASQGG